MASSYERELRAVLAGSPAGVRAVTRSCSEIERAHAMQVVQRPFLVVRVAGSGMDGSGDIIMPLYAHRLKGVRGDSWRIFRVETSTLAGRLATLARRIPTLPLTRTGKPHLDWDQGLPLHKFLGVVCRTSEENGLSRIVEEALAIKMETETIVDAEPEPLPAWMDRFRA